MRPKLHNIVSYSMAFIVFGAVALVQGRDLVGSQPSTRSVVVTAVAMWGFHFARRVWESAHVHRYSKPAVPLGDVITEYIYYWGFAAWNARSLFSSQYNVAVGPLLFVGLTVFAIAEYGNAKAHRMLRDLRGAGAHVRVIPRGFLFERVSCPHYFFEILSWVGFSLVAQTWAALAFTAVGAGILCGWARARHLAYKRDFDGEDGSELYPGERRALIPFVF